MAAYRHVQMKINCGGCIYCTLLVWWW